MKISVFTCLPAEDPQGGFSWFQRTKITVDVLTKNVTFYSFEGSEHTVCNHADTALSAAQQTLFRDRY